MLNEGMMSSNSGEWETPQWLFDMLDDEFHFDLDVCATHENHKCTRYFTKKDDGLSQKWEGTVWENPPYGRGIGPWVKKAMEHGDAGNVAVCLVPARTDTKWWMDHCMKASEIRLITGRLRFGNSSAGAPFPSAVVIFGTPRYPRFTTIGRE